MNPTTTEQTAEQYPPATELRQSPALVKLDLFCRGLCVRTTSLPPGARPVRRTRAGLGSGLELILPSGISVNAPTEEPFCRESPYGLEIEAAPEAPGGPVAARLTYGGEPLIGVHLPQRPDWYGRRTSRGTVMSEVATLQGTYLAIYASKVCDFWREGGERRCRFCSVGINEGEVDAAPAADDVLETVHAARAESGITYVDINTGHRDDEGHFDDLAPLVRRIKQETGLLVGVQAPPVADHGAYQRIRRAGTDRISFCPEFKTPSVMAEISPGKAERYGWEGYVEAMRVCAPLFDTTNGELIAGLEPAEATIEAIREITALGAIPTVCVFRPLVGAVLEHRPPPTTASMRPVFRALYEACMERHLPIGVAPGIEVSLVVLPNEARAFSTRSFALAEARLSVLGALARARFAWHVARARRRAEACE